MKRSSIMGLALILALVCAAIGASAAGADETTMTRITLGNKITVSGPGATVNGSTVEITEGGSYSITGTLKDGAIKVVTKDAVMIELDDASVNNSSGPALISDGDVTIELKSWTSSVLANRNYDKGDKVVSVGGKLYIEGGGLLEVQGYYCSGISALNDVTVADGIVKIYASGDGLTSMGSVNLSGGSVDIDCEGRGIYSKGELSISDGKVISVGGVGAKEGGLLSDTDLKVTGGTVIATGNSIATISSDSTQASIYAKTGTRMDAGDCFYVMYDSKGMFSFAPSNSYSNIYYSSADLVEGETYDIYVGGKIKSMFNDTIYTEGRYVSGVHDVVMTKVAAVDAIEY